MDDPTARIGMDDFLARGQAMLEGEHVRLRGLRDDDLDRLADWNQDPCVGLFHTNSLASWSQPAQRESLAGWGARGSNAGFAVVDRISSALVGALLLKPLRAGTASLHIFLGPDVLGRGYGTDAVRVAIRYATTDMQVHRLELQTSAVNERAIRAYRRAGFVHEGTLRHVARVAGVWVDYVAMSYVVGLDDAEAGLGGPHG